MCSHEFEQVGKERVLIGELPFQRHMLDGVVWRRHHWPAGWIAPRPMPVISDKPVLFVVRKRFTLDAPATIRVHVSADERYAFYVDGALRGRGPERGDTANWFFETFDLKLDPGEHTLAARVWALGHFAPMAQLTSGPGFLLAAEEPWGEILSTGRSAWEACEIDAIEVLHFPQISHDGYTGKKLRVVGSRYPFGVEAGQDTVGWSPAVRVGQAGSYPEEIVGRRSLRPAMLPPMLAKPIGGMSCRFAQTVSPDEDLGELACDPAADSLALREAVKVLLDRKGPVTVPAGRSIRAIIDLGDYYCAYPHLTATGPDNGIIRLGWAESLYVRPMSQRDNHKGHRDEVAGKYFRGFADEFVTSGQARTFPSFWWQAGRYIQLQVIAPPSGDVTLDALTLEETRYPLPSAEKLRVPATTDPLLAQTLQLARRSLEVGLHETFTDSPYYEQLAYIGDVRLECLALYTLCDDDRPARKAIELLDASRSPVGFTQSCYPSRTSLVIAPYALLWVGLVYDFMRLRQDLRFVRERLPGVRAVIDGFLRYRRSDGLIVSPEGWNFFDWSPGFVNGEVPDPERSGVVGPMQWQTALAVGYAAELESAAGDPELALRFQRLQAQLGSSAHAAFWVEAEGLWSDDLGRTRFSEHSQALAILASKAGGPGGGIGSAAGGVARAAARLATAEGPQRRAPATVYFTHYVLEALAVTHHTDAISPRLDLFRAYPGIGLKCLPEEPEPTRSDSHAWGCHLIHHLTKHRI